MLKFRIGSVYRYAKQPMETHPEIDGVSNFHFLTRMEGMPRIQLEKGISAPASVEGTEGRRVPAIFLSSSEHKRGSVENPWHDEIEPDDGYALYYGDNRTPGVDPGVTPGNRILLRQFELHTSPDAAKRNLASPLLIFRTTRKGFKEFCGLGLLTGARRVTQFSKNNGGYFTNYVFEIAVLSLTEEDEAVSMNWVEARRSGNISLSSANNLAPAAWRAWLQFGAPVLDKVRRRITRYRITPKIDQVPQVGSPQRQLLEHVYQFYSSKKVRFEALASLVCDSAIRSTGVSYRRGWITQSTGDGGLDFVGRIDVGDGDAKTKLVLLGQAKCEALDCPTGGVHVARTVARLRRGWVGAYVTTSFFSAAVQREVYEDQYPVMLINGMRVCEEVRKLQLAGGYSQLNDFLSYVDGQYDSQVSSRRPEEILWD